MSASSSLGVWKASVITLFPNHFPGLLGASLVGRALERGIWRLETLDLREFGSGSRREVDAPPFGGGGGMILRVDSAARALDAALEGATDSRPRLALSARGTRFDQRRARELSRGGGVILLCGRFEGIDERLFEGRGVEEVSVGDFILSGGEVAACAILEATVRLLSGVVGGDPSSRRESFDDDTLQHGYYAPPRMWEGRGVPATLLSGDHGAVESHRRRDSSEATRRRRPDLVRRGGG